jgi:hypothetical protein
MTDCVIHSHVINLRKIAFEIRTYNASYKVAKEIGCMQILTLIFPCFTVYIAHVLQTYICAT